MLLLKVDLTADVGVCAEMLELGVVLFGRPPVVSDHMLYYP